MKNDHIFELLIDQGRNVDINSVDEEELSVLHRLSTSAIRRTRCGGRYLDLVFRGKPENAKSRLSRTISAILKLGGDPELLRKPPQPQNAPDDSMYPFVHF